MSALDQLKYAGHELSLAVNGRHWRWLTIWFGKGLGVVLSYRLDRFFFLLFGESYVLLRPFTFPLFLFLRVLSSNHEIDYRAEVGRGFKVLHPTLGLVVSGETIAGTGLVLTGGNCLGHRGGKRRGKILLGNDVTLGANAVVLGPVSIGSKTLVGAGAVVTKDAPANCTLVGVPARVVLQDTPTVRLSIKG